MVHQKYFISLEVIVNSNSSLDYYSILSGYGTNEQEVTKCRLFEVKM